MDDTRFIRVPPLLAAAAAVTWRLLLLAVAAYLAVRVLARLQLVVLPLVVAALGASVLEPPAAWLRARGWPPLLAAWAVVLGAAVVLAGAGAALVPQVLSQADELGQQVQAGVQDVQRWLAEGPLGLTPEQVSEYLRRAQEQLQANRRMLVDRVLGGVFLVGELLAGLLLALVLVFFLVKDGYRFTPWLAGWVGERQGERLRAVGGAAWRTLGAYVRGVAIVGTVDAVAIGAGLALLGVPLVIPLAVLTFFGAFFPLVGAVVAGAVAALVALVSQGPVTALIVVALTVAVQQLEGDVVAPVVLGRAVRLHPAVVLLALTAGGVLAGIVGAFLAVPTVAVAAAALRAWREGSAPPER